MSEDHVLAGYRQSIDN
ncbi:MAG: hypothetical protein V4521_14850, partial [Pseudomonadota bacterium]